MRIRYFLLSVLFIMSSTLFAQKEPNLIECDCSKSFSELTDKVEANYIGLKHFQQQGRGDEYEQRKREYIAEAGSIEAQNCAEFLQEFVDYFEDGHLSVLERPKYEGEALDSINAKIEREREDVSVLKSRLTSQLEKDKTNPIRQLIGEYTDGTSELIILKEGEAFNAYILSSKNESVKPGEIKAIFRKAKQGYRGVYYTYTHIPRFLKAGLYKEGTFLRVEGSIWIKRNSTFERELSMVNYEGGNDWPTVQKLDDDNVLMSIPKFSVDFDVWKKVLKENETVLLNAKNLIVDIRGNRGGNAIYFSIFNLFADREMPGGQGDVLASEDNLKYFERNLQYSKKIYGPVVEAIKKNMGEIVDGPLYPKRNYKRKRKSKVENVAILTDEACMSAAESFIIHMRQASSLVKTFGSPTAGVIDYTSVASVVLKSSGSQGMILGYPTSTLSTLHKGVLENGYNKTGIIPDVPIDNDVKDKVDFIMKYYGKN